MSAPEDVQTYLADQSIVDGGTGWRSVRGPLDDQQDQEVGTMADGGPQPPEAPSGSGMGDVAQRYPAVQVRIRSALGQWDTARAKEEEIYQALHGARDLTIDGTDYLSISARGEPAETQDENRRPNITRSYVLTTDA